MAIAGTTIHAGGGHSGDATGAGVAIGRDVPAGTMPQDRASTTPATAPPRINATIDSHEGGLVVT